MMGVQGAVDAAEAETPGGGGNGVPAAMAPSGATSPGAALSDAALPGAAPTGARGLAERGGLTPDRVEIIGGVHVEIYGAGAGAGPGLPVLAVHGFMSSRTQWMLNLPALVAARPVAVVELLGHGRSEAPEALSDYAPARYFETFETIRGLMGAPRWHLCGQSFGAAMTLRYQDAHPDVVAAQVFTNSTASFADPATPEAAALARERAERIRAEGREGLSAHRSHPSGARRFPAAVKAAMLEDAARLDPHAMACAVELTIPGVAMRHRFRAIETPTLMVNGVWEKRFQPWAAWARTALPTLRSTDLEGGHSINVEQPAAFDAAVTQFLAAYDT
ncbi:2-succinyl-6-hydroxy-2,4-cyclohexadiene-1-carboxylate synthase [Albimonas donghaensis]|uniref:2-succinyl-6-hydroxy-2,4-cyclohexadiene-1-carboxylate synthase n=1 Tax=Albimonas donghaensis TaxID=356660 RepID=A0A1H2S064_9RHOB|nr:alpha/beta hydrolase [Albimonas donghaensis]SDW24938.1 2-succinyl-6-hydroxy-2,4-cyclohexadiene-1-carboxylate synthase [Albimonas donghaensis]